MGELWGGCAAAAADCGLVCAVGLVTTLADDIDEYIQTAHSALVREWWNMRDGSPVMGAWNFYFGRHPELGDALLVRLARPKEDA